VRGTAKVRAAMLWQVLTHNLWRGESLRNPREESKKKVRKREAAVRAERGKRAKAGDERCGSRAKVMMDEMTDGIDSEA